MPYGEIEVKSLDHGEELTSEPCYKKLKSTEEAYVFSHHGSANFHRIPQNTGNDWVPVTTVDVRGHSSQEDKTKATDSLKSVREEVPGHNRPDVDVIESTDAQILQDAGPPLVSTDDEIYSTSKAFIGPIYKPPEKRKCNEARNQSDIINGIADKGRVQKQKLNSKESELDNELFQFYKEIEELENDKDDSEGSCREPEPSEEHLTAYHQGHNNDLLKSEEGKKRDISDVLQSHCDFQQHMGNEPCKYPCNGQVIPAFCHDSFTSFRPEWQSVHSFIVPPGPPLPSFNYHLNSQRFSASPNPSSSILHAQDGSQLQNGCYVNSCHVNWNCLTFHQNNDYIDCSENTSRAHSSTNGYSVQDGYVSNGFYEASEGCWKDPTDNHNGTDRLMSQQFQEEKLNKLQKLLILLRGLPGSGKTTLSRILLGQSRDGIVFSTDDYFHHQDGYRYNVNQLGDAHDWNQNRAKQAINQGRSPVIIDNTNTQAWEMKPYVEMAIGKGYRVEFHEPETWWKFDPEELEKRNKHGVSRKKIAQMLDRYEYEMSISIVMNSVEPSHKSTQRPPPSQGRQRESDLKKTGHRFSKNKQKRNRKRSKKQNSHGKIMGENSFETLHYHTPGDQDPSQSEEEDVDDTKRESACAFTGGLGSELRDLVNSHKDAIWKSVNPEDCFPNVISAVKLDNTPKNYPPKEHDDLFPSMSLMPNENSVTCPTMTQNLSCTASDEWPGTKVGKDAVDRHPPASDVQDGSAAIPCSFVQKRERGDKRLLNETFLCNQYGPRTSDKSLRKDQGINTTENDYWAFFSNNLSDEELQLSSERQPCFESWPEGPHKFICEQRPKRDRWQRLASLDSRGQVIKLISTSEGTSRPGSSPETSLEEKLLIENEDLSPPTEDIDSVIETETNVFRSCLPKLDIPKSDLCSTKNKKRKQKRVFNLAPNFNLREPRYIDVKERGDCSMLTETHGLKIILEAEKDRISEISSIEENKQKLTTFDHHPSWFCFDIIKGPPLSFGTQSYSRYLPFSRLRHPVYFYKNPIPSLVLQYTSSFWMVSFTSKKPSLTFKSQTRVGNQLNDIGLSSSEILSSQPDTLYSFRVTSDLHFLNESFDEKLKTGEEPKPLRFLQTEDNQDITSTGFDSLELQLSQGFAFQLVKLFGSPGVPMESLLPDDYVVSVDWETLKMIYLQWKTSVEKRQKKIG